MTYITTVSIDWELLTRFTLHCSVAISLPVWDNPTNCDYGTGYVRVPGILKASNLGGVSVHINVYCFTSISQ